ncbi:MAG: hypothetical protein AVDCRST_MAG73-3653 [uncultured Thermomicrobiales bacterium]|uniref:Uncharacterized protein n=1 Tax=uncultured Thermomicrobiales bacterium TaxID=1645740 RepID=A0A6J4UWG8_9BACT|nr:MAG: hypothetical protein AVDCRST_MAG73-3653 [uncultured Thermomicrobiales bacterium]
MAGHYLGSLIAGEYGISSLLKSFFAYLSDLPWDLLTDRSWDSFADFLGAARAGLDLSPSWGWLPSWRTWIVVVLIVTAHQVMHVSFVG